MALPPNGSTRQYSTFDVARVCGVFHTTVINWVNKGKLKAHCTPGGHRRILLPDLIDFMQRFDMPIPDDLTQRTKKILIVEDDSGMQKMLKRALGSLPDVELQSCAGGLEALMAIGKEAPDVMILDIRIPQVNGVEVCKVLKSSDATRPIKIIAISGEPLPAEAAEFLKKHVEGFFQKPLPTAELKAKVAELLDVAEHPTHR
ncbi:MAG: response regulator [Proteobacteria bacterium]|nr:response regulator [Pseudomonadota bacterium]